MSINNRTNFIYTMKYIKFYITFLTSIFLTISGIGQGTVKVTEIHRPNNKDYYFDIKPEGEMKAIFDSVYPGVSKHSKTTHITLK